MLPEFLVGSYQKYKQDTATFTTWLANAAASSGYKPKATKSQQSRQSSSAKSLAANERSLVPDSATAGLALPTNGRLKGKARKAAREAVDKAEKENIVEPNSRKTSAVRYTVTTAELLHQADAVAQSYVRSRVQMPANLQAVVKRAIRARQRCSDWFRKSDVHNKYADKQHMHFIEVLEQSLKILEPCIEAEDATHKHQTREEILVEKTDSIENRFSLLNVEESPDIDISDISEVAATVNVAAKTNLPKDEPEIAVYELEGESEFDEELAFVIFSGFFEDLHRTQDLISKLWYRYKERKCDLHTAAITTNAAFDLVRQAEEDLIAQAPKIFDSKRSYDSIAIIVFYADAFQQGVCPEARLEGNESLRITPFDDFIYLSTARILMKFTFIASLSEECELPFSTLCPPLRLSYIFRPDLLGTPEMNRREEEDLILSRLIIDRQLWNRFKVHATKSFCPPPLEDEFSQSLDRLTKEGVLSAALVFEARIFLDIQTIMGDDVKRGHHDLVQTANTIDKIMNLKAVGKAWDVGGSGERWHERDVDVVIRIKETSMFWILDSPTNLFPELKKLQLAESQPPISFQLKLKDAAPQIDVPEGSKAKAPQAPKVMPPKNPKLSSISMETFKIPAGVHPHSPEFEHEMRKHLVKVSALPDDGPVDPEHEEIAKKLKPKMVRPSEDPNYLFTTNPIYCGLASFSLLTDFETAGISLSNWHKSIWPTAHLYNALQQTSRISKSWPEMEELIDLHVDTLFAGQVPLSAYEFFMRFALALGLSISNFSRSARNRTNNDRIRFRQGANGIKLKMTETSRVFRQYFEKKSTLEVCLLKLDNLIRDPGPKASRKEKQASKRTLTNLQFLAMLEANVPQVTQRLKFDYITLTKQCAKLLKDIRRQIQPQFQIAYPRIHTEDSADQTLTWAVMQILEENKGFISSRGAAQTPASVPIVGPQLKVAGEVMQKFIATYKPQHLISNFNALSRPPRTPFGLVPNHWNISIRHVALSPPGDLVFFVQPDSHCVHTEGPIQTVEGQTPGHVLNPKSLATLQTIARLIMKGFFENLGAPPGAVTASAPHTWATNDPNFARRIMKVMTDMGVRAELLHMAVADEKELAICDEEWNDFSRGLTDSVEAQA